MTEKLFDNVSTYLDSLTGLDGSIGVRVHKFAWEPSPILFGSANLTVHITTIVLAVEQYLVIIVLAIIGYKLIHHGPEKEVSDRGKQQQEEEEADKPRNFTEAQLAKFDGTIDPKTNEAKPVYLSLNGIVFDVSDGRHFYGPGKRSGICISR